MRRREFIVVVGGAAVAWPLAARAQQTKKVYRIGVLSPESLPPGLLESFQEELRQLGYIEGENIAIESRNAGGRNERLAALADDLVRLQVDVILAVNTPAVQAAKKATTTIPIVMTRAADPVKTGIVSSLSHPGGNITGLTFIPEELSAKRLQLLKEVLPSTSRVAVLWNEGNSGTTIVAKEMEPASSQLGLELLRLPVRDPSELPGVFQAAAQGGAEALVIVDDVLITRYRVEIIDSAMKHSLPVVSLFKGFAEAGALIAYGPSTSAMHRRAAHYVDKILKGAKPSDLPIEQPTKFDLILNLKTAKALGIEIPPSLLARADEVIE